MESGGDAIANDQNIRNTADHKQVRAARRREKQKRENELIDLQTVLNSEPGRRFVWRLLQHCKVFSSIWSASAQIHYDAGRQDVGHFVLAEIAEADDEAIFRMMREAQVAEKREAQAINAEAAPPADEGEKTNG